ncbi:peptide deformylase [Burkholderia ubonensis]|uniref:peptide deformylase n=1 Tax=Burkholderia ubonensis TaxID=101571 RepID=UPI0009B2F66A|nr:peptide deformylase [Burkholderia ubonensis]
MIRTLQSTESPILRECANSVTDFSDVHLRPLIDDMFETMRAGKGVGLAAPQIGISLRIIVFEFSGNDFAHGEPSIPATVLINPVIIDGSGSLDGMEGCFSVPGYIGVVSRCSEISYIAQDIDGNKVKGVAKGLSARIIQHEVDHLNGILYSDKAKKMVKFGTKIEQ